MPEEKTDFRKQLSLYVLLLGILITAVLLSFSAHSEKKATEETVYHLLELYGVRTESLLNSLFHKTDILESVIITNRGDLDQTTFDNLAKPLMEGEGIRAIQCLPGGTVDYCYPLEGNERVMGNNIFENPLRKEDALLALETKQIALSGPYDLTQGGLGLVARNPIFLTNSDGTDDFWGFSVVILDLPQALSPLMLSEMKGSGYEYQISCEVNGAEVIVDQSFPDSGQDGSALRTMFEKEAGSDYVAMDIHVPNHTWQLKMAPNHGWINKKSLILEGLVCLLFTLLLTTIVWLIERQGRQMKQFATTDELTGLFNRRRLKEYIDIRCRDKKILFAMFYMDLNRFKSINDTVGHAGGDAVLRESGTRIKTALGKEGSVYRIGGDEFIAIKELDVSLGTCDRMVLRINEELAKPFSYEGNGVDISASIGYAIFPAEGADLDELLRLADERMYLMKSSLQPVP